jgi:hypothetical protein
MKPPESHIKYFFNHSGHGEHEESINGFPFIYFVSFVVNGLMKK